MTFDQLNPAGAADCVINLVVDLDRDQPSALFCSSLVYQFFLPLFLLCLSVFISFVLTLSDSSNQGKRCGKIKEITSLNTFQHPSRFLQNFMHKILLSN